MFDTLEERLEMYRKDAQYARRFYEELLNSQDADPGDIEQAKRDYERAEETYRSFVAEVERCIEKLLRRYPEF